MTTREFESTSNEFGDGKVIYKRRRDDPVRFTKMSKLHKHENNLAEEGAKTLRADSQIECHIDARNGDIIYSAHPKPDRELDFVDGKSTGEDPIESTEKLANLLAKEMQANTRLAAEFIAGADKGKFTSVSDAVKFFGSPAKFNEMRTHIASAFGKPLTLETQDATIQIGGAELNQPYLLAQQVTTNIVLISHRTKRNNQTELIVQAKSVGHISNHPLGMVKSTGKMMLVLQSENNLKTLRALKVATGFSVGLDVRIAIKYSLPDNVYMAHLLEVVDLELAMANLPSALDFVNEADQPLRQ